MSLFTPSITQTIGLVTQGTHVRVRAHRLMGRTRFLSELSVELEKIGFNVVSIRGRALYADLAFGAIRNLLSATAATHLHPLTVTDELTRLFQAERRTVVVIDDDVDVDEPSLVAIAEAAQRSGAAIVAGAIPFKLQTPAQRHRSTLCDFGALVTLPLLDYDDISALAHEILGGSVSALIVVRATSKSSGIAGLAAHILTTARISGAIVLEHGRWVMAEDTLWNPHLLPVVESYFDGLSGTEFATLYELALLGGCDLNDLPGADRAEITSLDNRGLLTTFTGRDGRTVITVTPMILLDYFRQRQPDTISARVLARIADAPQQVPERPDSAQLTAEAAASRIDDFSLARLMRDREQERLEAARVAYRCEVTPTTVVAYLMELTRSPIHGSQVRTLLVDLDLDGYTETQLLFLGCYAAMWADEVDLALPLVGRILDRAPDLKPAFTAIAMRARFNSQGRTAEVDAWLDAAVPDPVGVATAVAHYVRAVAGEPTAVPVEQRIGDPLLVEPLYYFADSLVALREGHSAEILASALARRDEDRGRYNKDFMLIRSYIAVLVLMRTGEWDRARALIASTLALGSPSKHLVFVYVALMRFSVMMHARHADHEIAGSLIADLGFYGPVDGVLPGMQAGFEQMLAAYLAEDSAIERNHLVTLARSSIDHGVYESAIIMLNLSLALAFTADAVALLREITASRDDHRHEEMLRIAEQILAQDAGLAESVAAISSDNDRFVIFRMLLQARAHGPETGSRDPQFARVLDSAIETVRPTISETADIKIVSAAVQHEALTLREREIALLAVSLSNSDISQRLGLSVRTVENHIARAMKKVGATSRAAFQNLL